MARAVAFVWIILWGSAWGQNTDLDKRTAALADELSCLVCQNQTLADSNAPLAVDLRKQIREQLAGGANGPSQSAMVLALSGGR